MSSKKMSAADLLRLSGSYWETFVLHVAVKLNVFGIIGGNALTGEFLSTIINANEDGILRLLNALSAMNLICKNENKYQNSEVSRIYLCPESKDYLGNIIKHHANLVGKWANLETAILSGHPTKREEEKDITREHFLMGMHDLAMLIAPQVLPLIDLAEKKYLLDLGGGPGTYAVHFCKKNPKLKACVFDRPSTRPFMEKVIKKFNLSNSIFFTSGDFVHDPIGNCYDVAWLSHILHSLSPHDCKKVVKKVNHSLNKKGIILIHEFILNDALDTPLFPALFSLNMLIGTSDGRSYSEQQLSKLLSECGFKKIRKIEFDSYNRSSILLGIKL